MNIRKFIKINESRYRINTIKRFEPFKVGQTIGVYIYYGASKNNPKRESIVMNSDSEISDLLTKLKDFVPEAVCINGTYILPGLIKKYEPIERGAIPCIMIWFGVAQLRAQAEVISFDIKKDRDDQILALDDIFATE